MNYNIKFNPHKMKKIKLLVFQMINVKYYQNIANDS